MTRLNIVLLLALVACSLLLVPVCGQAGEPALLRSTVIVADVDRAIASTGSSASWSKATGPVHARPIRRFRWRRGRRPFALRSGLPLMAAAADKACEVIGAGCVAPSIGCLSYGTTATINTTHRKYVEAMPMIPPYPAALPGFYSLEIQIFRGYWMVSWFKQQFGHREQAIADERGI